MFDGINKKIVDFIQSHNSDHLYNVQVYLFGIDCIAERNETYEVNEYLPDYLAIGSDSGDYFFLVRRNNSLEVYWSDVGAFTYDSIELVHPDFLSWVSSDCPIPEEEIDPEWDLPLKTNIHIIEIPNNGLKTLYELKKILGLNHGLGELKKILTNIPTCLIVNKSAIAIKKRLLNKPDLLCLLAYEEEGEIIKFT